MNKDEKRVYMRRYMRKRRAAAREAAGLPPADHRRRRKPDPSPPDASIRRSNPTEYQRQYMRYYRAFGPMRDRAVEEWAT